MKKQLKRICAMLLIITSVCTVLPATIKAEEAETTPILTILDSASLYLEKSNGKALITGYISADTSATKTTMHYELQKYTSGSWNTVNSWTKTANDDVLAFSTSYAVGSGKYRVVGTAYAYIGTQKESLSITGNSVTF